MSDISNRLDGLSPEKLALLNRRLAARSAAPAPAPAAPSAVERIAVVAAACRLPGGVRSPDDLWQLLLQGRDAVTDVPADRWDGSALFAADATEPRRINSRCGGFLDQVGDFDAAFFGISPREAALMDPQQRLLLEVAWEALESAGQAIDRLAGSATGVFVGAHSHSADYFLLQLAQRGGVESHSSTGSAHSILANRLSYTLDFRGPSMTVDTACSSSLVAVHLACQSLRTRECDMALAGGVNLMLLPTASLAFTKLQILSSDGRCRSFDAAANGIVRGEGCGLVVLKRLSDAERDGDPVLAVIAGSAVNQDGASNGLTAPNGPAQEAVIRRALAMAGVAPERVGLFETHGTGTAMGDPVEVDALTQVVGAARDAEHRCYLGALKSHIGHLEAAAGIAGLIKAVWCLRHQQVPANLHFKQINPHIRLDGTPFVIPTATAAWPPAQGPRVAGVSSFGFGGTNAHVVLQEHENVTPSALANALPDAMPRDELLTVSARSAAALMQRAKGLAQRLRATPVGELADVLYSANVRRAHHDHRLAVVGRTPDALVRQIDTRLADAARTTHGSASAQVVFVYSGQGGQWPAMGRELYETEPVFRARLLAITDTFQRLAGWDLLAVLTDPLLEPRLASTEVAQPAIFALQTALTALWRSWGLRPGAIVGHSVGEVAAAHAAGVLTLEDAVKVVLHRSRAMQPGQGQGRMVQVECSPSELRATLAAFAESVSIAALNGPASTVLSGAVDTLEACVRQLEARGVKTRALPVDYAFHSAQMDRFVPEVVRSLAGLRTQRAEVPLMSTVSGRWSEGTDFDAAYWGRNVRDTVRFAPALSQLLDSGFRSFLEVGPHPSLGAGIGACADAAGINVTVAASLRRTQPARAALLASLGQLYESGADIDWAAGTDPKRRVVPLPAYPWQRHRYWLDEPDPAALAFNVTGCEGQAAPPEGGIACYEMQWRAAPMHSQAPSPLKLDWQTCVDMLAAVAGSLPESGELAQEGPVRAELERRGVDHAWQALHDLGLALGPGQRVAVDTAATVGVQIGHARLWRRLLQMLEAAGLLQATGDGWVVTPRSAYWQATRASRLPPASVARVEAVLLERCGAALADVLRGRVDPLSLLFPADGQNSAAAVYADTPSARVYNRLAAETLALVRQQGDGRPLRVLEIGAGTGATTAALLPVLAPHTAYCYTDASPLFLHEAEHRLNGSAIDFTFQRLDIEQPPDTQGLRAGAFDIVVAANVLHATADLARTLGHVRSLLAPGGLLVLIETVARRAWTDLSFGLIEGWWRFADPGVRTEQALVPAAQWSGLLADAGFDRVQAIGDALSHDSIHPQALLLARAAVVDPLTAPSRRLAGTAWLVVADRGGVGTRLAAAIAAEGGVCECLDGGAASTAAGEHDAGTEAVLRLWAAQGGRWQGVVQCTALDASAALESAPDRFDPAAEKLVASALTWAQRLPQATDGSGPRLWLVTRGAQHIPGTDQALSPAQAPLWGLGRSLALEMPPRWGGLIDLDPDAPAEDLVASLLDELCGRGSEDQIARRASGRFVARLARRSAPRGAGLALDPAGSYLVTGGYGGLGPKIAEWLVAQGARHLVLLGRTGVIDRAQWDSLPAGHPDAAAVEAIRSLRSRGVEVRTERADVADPEAMRALFARLRQDGVPLRGVVHAAAVIRFQSIDGMTPQDVSAALRAKVQGGRVLHELTRDEPLDLFVLFSSGTAVFGAKGLAAYAAANQYLGTLAWQRNALGLPAVCVDWGAWSEIRLLGGESHDAVERLGFRAMNDASAFDILAGLVRERVPQCLVADIDWSMAGQAYQAHGVRPFLHEMATPAAPNPSGQPVAEMPRDLRAELATLAPRERRARVVRVVSEELARVLGLPDVRDVDASKGFFDLGLDSLMAVQLRRRLADVLNEALPATLTFNYPNVAELADHLLGKLAPETPAAVVAAGAVTPPRPDRPPEPDGTMDALSDAEVHRLLLAELNGLPDDLGTEGAPR